MGRVSARPVTVDGAARVLAGAASATVLAHAHPDADTLGSAFALALALDRAGTPVCVSFPGPHTLPGALAGLPGSGHLVEPAAVPREADTVIAVDCSSADRLGELAGRLEGAGTALVIDHHPTYTGFGGLCLVDPSAQSTTAIVSDVLRAWGAGIDRDIAQCLYAGLATDTGGLRRADADSLRRAADLLDTGFDGPGLLRTLMDSHPFGWLAMVSAVLGRAEIDAGAAGGRGLVHAAVLRRDCEGLTFGEAESVIDIVRTADEAEVAAVFKELPEEGRWAVSLRSQGAVDVAETARALGGGGHRAASGYTAAGPLEDVLAELRARLG